MIPLTEKMYRRYLGLPIPDDWDNTDRADNVIKEQIQLSEERSAKIRKFCLGEGCTTEDMKNCGQFNCPCVRCVAFIMKLDKEEKK